MIIGIFSITLLVAAAVIVLLYLLLASLVGVKVARDNVLEAESDEADIRLVPTRVVQIVTVHDGIQHRIETLDQNSGMMAGNRASAISNVVSLGLFPMARRAIHEATGAKLQRYPFDDIITFFPMIHHFLEEGFGDYLAFDRLVPATDNKLCWSTEPLLEKFQTRILWANHDMRDSGNQTAMRDRVDRFERLDGNTLFVSICDAPAVFNGWQDRIRESLDRRFPGSDWLVIGIGEGEHYQAPGVMTQRLLPRSAHDGLLFADFADNQALNAIIRDHLPQSLKNITA